MVTHTVLVSCSKTVYWLMFNQVYLDDHWSWQVYITISHQLHHRDILTQAQFVLYFC